MRAYVVVGPTCSGADDVARTLTFVGAELVPSPALPTTERHAVLVREMSGEWQSGHHGKDLLALFTALRKRGYLVTPILVVRDPTQLARDQVAQGVAQGRLDAEARMRAAYSFFFTCLVGQDLEWHVVSYEGLSDDNWESLVCRLALRRTEATAA